MSDKFERTNPGLVAPDEKKAADDTGPIEGASAGARQFRKAAVIAGQTTREEVDAALTPADSKEKTPPEGTLRMAPRRNSSTFKAVLPTTAASIDDEPTAKRPTGGHSAVDISDSAQAARDHAREAQEILKRGMRRAAGEAVEPTQQFKVMKDDEATAALETPRRPSGALPVVPKEPKEEPVGKGFFKNVIDILKGGSEPESDK